MPAASRFLAPFVLPLALAACSYSDDRDAAANQLSADGANVTDPALTAALQDQIMVDPRLGQQANGDSVRPPTQPYSGPLPPDGVAANNAQPSAEGVLHAPAPNPSQPCAKCQAARDSVTLGGLAARQRDGRTSACASSLSYSATWATRLPADLPLYPQARVTEAAGSTNGSCALRVVSFSAAQPMQALIDWYYTRASKAGYSAEHQTDGSEHVLGGTRDRDGGAYVIYFTARPDGGTDADLIANNGS
jgi:hypothetical protein